MIRWALKKGLDGPEAQDPDGTTNIDHPDTPAPIFAARALKSAIFGTPAPDDDDATQSIAVDQDVAVEGNSITSRTPSKPQGILLTPGTGASRRKRVSFDHDALGKQQSPKQKPKARSESDKKLQGLFASLKDNAGKRTKLTEAMAKSRHSKDAAASTGKEATNGATDVDSDDEWERTDDDDGDDNDSTYDMTVDLDDPHSQSGKYWKSEFERYHQEAKTEMERLLRYKQLAKSYAHMMDSEAAALRTKLQEEQNRIVKMEKLIAGMNSQIASKREAGDDSEDLAKQTALAAQYKRQVKDLESAFTELQLDNENGQRRRNHRSASPRTQKTLLETQRELRQAREQARDNKELRRQVELLKSELSSIHRQANPASSASELEEQLQRARAENRQKDEELASLKKEFEAFVDDTRAREADSHRVLGKTQDKISSLKQEIKSLKAASDAAGSSASIVAKPSHSDIGHTLRRSRKRVSGETRIHDEGLERAVYGIPGQEKKTIQSHPIAPRSTPEKPLPTRKTHFSEARSLLPAPLEIHRKTTSNSASTAQTTDGMSPQRRAAAMARVERRRAERKASRQRLVLTEIGNQENVRPSDLH